MNKKLLITGAIFGVTGIILGAFAAHGLKKVIDANAVASFETGVRYQIYHAFLLLLIGSSSFVSTNFKTYIFYLVLFGVILFSGSIYALATNGLTKFDFKSIGFITPIGGLLLIVAWALMLFDVVNNELD